MAEFDDIFEPNEESKPAFNKEEWVKRQQENRTQAYEMLENATQEITNPDVFMSYLDVQSRFDRYSVSNALLVAYQMPEATRLCDSTTWKEHDVFIRKGESAILILEPGKEFKRQDGSVGTNYNAKKVFDISQTTAKQYPKTQKTYNERILVRALVKQSSVPVEISDKVPEESGAVYRNDNKKILIRTAQTSCLRFGSVFVNTELIVQESHKMLTTFCKAILQEQCLQTRSLLSCSIREVQTVKILLISYK